MINFLRCLLAMALAVLPLAEAYAGSSTITTKDASGVTKTFFVTTDGSGNFYAAGVICDQSAAASCASVGTAGSPSTNALTVQAVTLGHGTAANAMRVELPTDGTGLVNAAQSGTWNVGTVTTVTNLSQMNGAALLMGNGVTGTGSQRVTVASDNTAFSVNAVQSGTWNTATLTTLTGGGVASAAADSGNPIKIGGKYNSSPITLTNGNRGDLQLDVNGYVKVNVTNGFSPGQATMANSSPVAIASDQSAIPVTLTSTTITGTVAATQSGSWTNTVTQATAASLNATVVGTGTFVTQSTLAAETTKVIGTVRNVGNVGGVFDAVSGAAVPANILYTGVNVGGNLTPIAGDPCQTVVKNYTPVNMTTATTFRVAAETSAKKTYICHVHIVGAAADNVAMFEGTGATCTGGTPVGMAGSITAASGWNFSANGGISLGNGGYAVMGTLNANYSVCLITSAATQLSGHVAWVQQ